MCCSFIFNCGEKNDDTEFKVKAMERLKKDFFFSFLSF